MKNNIYNYDYQESVGFIPLNPLSKNNIIVEKLPEVGEVGTTYLVPNPNGTDDNKYIEYSFVDGKWEIIGSSNGNDDINLSGYLTIDQAEKEYQPKGDYLTNKDLETLVSKEELQNIENKIETISIPTKLSELENDTNFITEKYDDSLINERINKLESIDYSIFANKEEVNDAIKDNVKYMDFNYNGEERKTIQLNNYDNISSIDTNGVGHNLVMLSKWNVADFGAKGVHFNINTSDNITVNDDKILATTDIVDGLISEEKADSKYQPKGDYLTEHQDITNLVTKEEVIDALNNKVDKEDGKTLSSNDFTDNYKNKLESLENYDDTELRNVIPTKVSVLENDSNYQTKSEVDSRIQEIIGTAPEKLDTLGEIADKLKDNDDIVAVLTDELTTKANKSDLDNVVKYDNFIYNNEERKTIQLDNYDNISGVDTNGIGHNLVMLSKWNVADFGAKDIHFNINGIENERPTYNDNKQIAFVDDVNEVKNTIPSIEGLVSEKWVKEQNYLTEHQSLENYITKENITELYNDLNSKLKEKQDKGRYAEWKESTSEKGKYVMTIANSDLIMGRTNPNDLAGKVPVVQSAVTIAQVNAWNVVDLGSPKTVTNINTIAGERVTVQEAGQSGAEAHKIAYLSDIDKLDYVSKNEFNNFKSFIKSLFDNIDSVTTSDNKTKEEGDMNITGEYVGKSERTTYTVNNGNLKCYDLNITDSSLALVVPNGDVNLTEFKTNGNCFEPNKLRCLSIDGGKTINIKDCDMNEICYNGIQLNMDKALSDDITIENVKLNGVQNNGIIVFGTKDNVVINIKNIDIDSAKNAFRFSNRSNAQNVIVNIENINIGSVREKLFLFEDMKKEEGKETTDLFNNMTFNIKNVIINGKLITPETPYNDIMQMVVGRPSQNEDIQVELTGTVIPTFNFL